ncbi:MAG: putative CoA-binding protein [Ilumatobacter sp.]|jgi:predicted CoA-binding protein
MAAILELMQDRLDLLQRTRSIAIVGMSKNSSRSSHFVATYLAGSTDFDVYYVNPRETEILGKQVYASLADLPVVPDIVDVFRRVEDLPAVADEAIAIGATALWFQLGLEHPEAAASAVAAGLDVVQNRCLKIEHARFRGGLHTAGFNTGVIDSRRVRLV